MKKRLWVLGITVLGICLAGCGGDNNQNETTTSPTTMVEDNLSAKTKDVAAEPAQEDIEKLTNERQDCYFGGDVNADGVPLASLEFREKYGKYSADFVKTDDEKKKVIYLTFDEGYENGYTGIILDVLKEKDVEAVFFVTMPYVETETELVQRMIDEGHIVGNHSVTHPSEGMISLSLKQQKDELQELHNYVKDNYGGYEMKLFRYPAGIYSEQSLALVESFGYRSVFWSFAYADWDPGNQPDNAEALDKLISSLHPGGIYLLHAVSQTNAEILGDFIDGAREQGYEFETYY